MTTTPVGDERMNALRITAGKLVFTARFEDQAAPLSCAAFRRLLLSRAGSSRPGWSGEAAWMPRWAISNWASDTRTTPVSPPRGDPALPGRDQRDGILFPYGSTRFASKVGQLAGNHFSRWSTDAESFKELGRLVLWEGAQDIQFRGHGMNARAQLRALALHALPRPRGRARRQGRDRDAPAVSRGVPPQRRHRLAPRRRGRARWPTSPATTPWSPRRARACPRSTSAWITSGPRAGATSSRWGGRCGWVGRSAWPTWRSGTRRGLWWPWAARSTLPRRGRRIPSRRAELPG